ncbi:MAG: aminoacyltransferase [Bacteroidales bacterium]|jgi:hypothetical protein|nr:aminoacyltransferase [Bacteroidales bacterium]
MIELQNADEFIRKFERYGKKIHRIPLTFYNGRKVNLLMSKCGFRWLSLPYMSEGVLETDGIEIPNPFFSMYETEDGNICTTRNVRWEIRDRRAFSNFLYKDKINFCFNLKDANRTIFDFYPSNIRRKVRKALNNELVLKSGGRQYIKHFYKVYSRRMYEIGVCPAGRKYIRKRLACGDYTLFVVYYKNKPVGAASLMQNAPNIMENEFFATDSKFNNLYTSYLLHFGMMTCAKDANCDYLLGRSTYESSVYNYKLHFKAQQYQLFWSYSYRIKNIRDNRFFYRLWKILPYRVMLRIAPYVHRLIY